MDGRSDSVPKPVVRTRVHSRTFVDCYLHQLLKKQHLVELQLEWSVWIHLGLGSRCNCDPERIIGPQSTLSRTYLPRDTVRLRIVVPQVVDLAVDDCLEQEWVKPPPDKTDKRVGRATRRQRGTKKNARERAREVRGMDNREQVKQRHRGVELLKKNNQQLGTNERTNTFLANVASIL